MDTPEGRKFIRPYVRRAEEVEKTGDARAYVIAYYCRTFAMEQGLKMSGAKRSPELQALLLELMNKLEKEKAQHPDLGDAESCEEVVRGFATEMLTAAETEFFDLRAGKNTARRYYAAASFFEVLATFAADKKLDEATKKTCLYAKYRANEILKAIKEGRDPVPTDEELAKAQGLDGGAQDEQDDEDDFTAPPAAPKSDPRRYDDSSDEEVQVAKPKRAPAGKARMSKKFTSDDDDDNYGGSGYTDAQKSDALEYTKFAMRAIEMDDVKMAIKHLKSALRELGE